MLCRQKSRHCGRIILGWRIPPKIPPFWRDMNAETPASPLKSRSRIEWLRDFKGLAGVAVKQTYTLSKSILVKESTTEAAALAPRVPPSLTACLPKAKLLPSPYLYGLTRVVLPLLLYWA